MVNFQPHRPTLRGQRHWSGLSILSKRSYRSFATSSFEADDERSATSDDEMSSRRSDSDFGGRLDDRRLHTPLYPGHDARPTSRKELTGWYMYAFAAETYVICGIGSFIPILLETLARENGVLREHPDVRCGASDSKNKDDGQCIVYVLGMVINTASFAMYTFSISVLIQALLVVSISCAADHGEYRKKLLLAFAWIGSFAVMGYIFISKDTYIIGALLTIISNTSFGASFVLLNSFLPLLVRNHPDVIEVRQPLISDLIHSDMESRPLEDSTGDLRGDGVDSESPLLSVIDDDLPVGTPLKKTATHQEITSKELELSTQMSSKGIGIGYGAALFLQCVAIGVLVALHNTTWGQRVVLFMVGLWWTVFTIPAAMWLRPRPGPPLTTGSKGRMYGFAYLIYAWKSLFKTILLARRLVDIVLFLAGWFLLSDAIATTSSTAILFAKTQLHMPTWALGLINVISTLGGVLGALGWSWLSRTFNLKPHQTILVCIALFELIPIYGLAGYLPFVQRWGVLGLQQPWEMYPLAGIYGLVLGGLSSYCRALYGELIPPGSEAAFYALYAITDKGSSVFGPSIVGAIIDKAGDIRPAFWFLAVIVGLPAPIMWFIDVERGRQQGEALARSLVKPGVEIEVDEDDEDNYAEQQGMMADFDDRDNHQNNRA